MPRDRDAIDRESGVGFDDVATALDDHDYPATGRALIEEYGDRQIDHQRGSKRFGEVLEPLAEETFESKAAVQQAVLSVIGEEAVGREGYSDRDPPRLDEPGADDRSF